MFWIRWAPPEWLDSCNVKNMLLIKHCHKTSFQLPATAASAHMHLPTCQPLWIISAPAHQLSPCNPRPIGKFFLLPYTAKWPQYINRGWKDFWSIPVNQSPLPRRPAVLICFPFGKKFFDSATRSQPCELSGVTKVIGGHISVSTAERTSGPIYVSHCRAGT